MIKSKHFRKDVIMARVIVLVAALALIIGVCCLASALTKPKDNGDTPGSSELELPSSEKESESDSEPESVTEPETNTEPETGSEPDTDQPTETPTKYYVQATAKDGLNVRKEPNTNCAVLGTLANGTKVELVEELDGWYKIIYEGKEGYISSKYSKVVEE